MLTLPEDLVEYVGLPRFELGTYFASLHAIAEAIGLSIRKRTPDLFESGCVLDGI